MLFKRMIASASLAAVLMTSAFAAPDNTLGMALLSATVASDGELSHGSGAISAVRNGAGEYDVVFDRSLVGCSCTASGGSSSPISSVVNRIATANCPRSDANRLRVHITLLDGSANDSPFHAIAFCPK